MYILTTAALVPLVAALFMAFLRTGVARVVALVASLVPLALAIYMVMGFDPGVGMQYSVEVPWIPALGAYYSLGVDGIALAMILLTAILTPIVVLYSGTEHYRSDQMGEHAFLGFTLAIEGLSIFVFSSTDVLLFYLFFEATLIPMFFLIGGFGGENRRYAAIKFLLYSLGSGLLMLAAIIGVYVLGGGSFLLTDLQENAFFGGAENWLFAGFMIAFIVKAPMVPFHTWLPDAAENTTPGGAVMMVAIMDKIGTFGMIRFAMCLFPGATYQFRDVMVWLAVLSIIWGALAALAQSNLMRFVAYTSVSHFGFIVLGIFTINETGTAAASLYMFNHGLSTAMLFLVVGYMIKRRGSADIHAFGGVQKVAPLLGGYLLIALLSAVALPGLAPFVSEFGVIAGTFNGAPVAAGIAAIAMVLAACYIMRVYKTTMTGEPGDDVIRTMPDLTHPERWVLAPLIVLLFVFGVYPEPLTTMVNPAAQNTVNYLHDNGVPPVGSNYYFVVGGADDEEEGSPLQADLSSEGGAVK
ncbi:MAG: NADH-quinone oxidoreductase subunit M [Corynebacterium pyruviciproducens]|uniref:NADH-quinone oxidoreductase subunit M n=1 Tax=Corynebacterium pyruviciproducens TaxID=598660 RepID=UPI003983A81D